MKNFFERLLKTSAILIFAGFFLLFAQEIRISSNDIYFAQQVLISGSSRIKKALFSPDEAVKRVLIGLINAEKSRMRIAIYNLTDLDVYRAILDAVKRGVTVEIIADRASLDGEWSKIPALIKDEVCVFIFPPAHAHGRDPLMHNKFIIFSNTLGNRQILWTGSFNFTRSAANVNQENVLILEDRDLVHAYIEQFKRIKRRSALVSGVEPLLEVRTLDKSSLFDRVCTALGLRMKMQADNS